MATLEQRAAHVLNDYLIQHVWNQPQREYRRVVTPVLVSRRALHGTWDYRYGQITLPDTTKDYYVFKITAQQLAGVPLHTTDEWKTLATLMDTDRLDVKMYTQSGVMLYRDRIYLHPHSEGEHWLVAVERSMLRKIIGTFDTNPESYQDVYMEFYYDTDAVANLRTWHFYLNNQAAIDAAYARITDDISPNEVLFINGWVRTITTKAQLHLGDYVECYDDGNVYCEFTVNPFDGSMRTYASVVCEETAYIVHIPKALNPEYYVLPHNLCDVYAIPSDGSPGLLVQRSCTDTRGFIQLTHGDFAIPNNVIQAYYATFNASNPETPITYELRILVRYHPQALAANGSDPTNHMIRDANYIDVLYLHSDAEIVQFMAGDNSPMPFWLATTLEQSAYPTYMFDYRFNPLPADIQGMVDTLGYYQALSILCPQIQRFTITAEHTRTFTVDTPLLFEDKSNVTAHVFIDGYKIHDSFVSVIPNANTETVQITLDATVAFPVDGEVVVELHETTTVAPQTIVPNETTRVVVMPNEDFVVHEEINVSPIQVYGIGATSSYAYKAIENDNVHYRTWTIPAGIVIEFLPWSYNRRYLIHSATGIYRFDHTSQTGIFGDTIRLNLTATINGLVGPRPILGDVVPLVYLNGKALVQHVDFELLDHQLNGEHLSFRQLAIQNISYLKDGGVTPEVDNTNTLEVYLCGGYDVISTYGHPTPGNPTGLADMFLWYPSLSMAYTDGVIFSKAGIRHGVFTADALPTTYGALSGSRTTVTYNANQILSNVALNTDTERIALLRAYLVNWFTTNEPSRILIPQSHCIYSVYMALIVSYLLNTYGSSNNTGVLDTVNIKRQVLRLFENYKRLDVVYTQTLDRRFIDVYPWYQKVTVMNTQLLSLIQDLAKLVTEVPDSVTHGDILQ